MAKDFRVATGEENMNTFIIKFTSLITVFSIAALLIQRDLFSSSLPVIIAQLTAIILVLLAKTAFRKQPFRFDAIPGGGPLVRRGPYRWLRHPMYASALLLVWASILGHWSILNAAIGLVLLIAILWRISLEEGLLRQRYPEYEDYARHSNRLIPFIY